MDRKTYMERLWKDPLLEVGSLEDGGDVREARRFHHAAHAALFGDAGRVGAMLGEAPGLALAREHGAAGPTLLHHATGMPVGRASARAVEIAELLLDAGADVGARALDATRGETVLHWAASVEAPDLVALLVARGADPDAPGGVAGTPLSNAVAFGHRATAARLAELGARPGFFEAAGLGLADLAEELLPDDRTLLEDGFRAACGNGRLATARRLHGLGARGEVGPSGEDPRGLARARGHAEVVAWLEGLG